MTKTRHASDPDAHILVRTFGVSFGLTPGNGRRGGLQQLVPPSDRNWEQLISATRGMASVRAGDDVWAVPAHRAVRIPGGTACAVEMHGEVALRILYFRARGLKACSVVNVTPLLRELIERTVRLGALNSRNSVHRRLYAVLRDEIDTLETAPLHLPAPRDERAVRFAAADAALTVPERLLLAGASRRTMERLFRAEAQMSLGQWVRRHKLLAALRLLSAGRGVKQTAAALGYANSGSFIAMFRRELGDSPGAWHRG